MLDGLKRWLRRSWNLEDPNVPLTGRNISSYFGWGLESDSGEVVSTGTALSYSPVWQGLDTITSDISRIPFLVYRRIEANGGEGKERAREHPAYKIMRRWTGEMTSNLWLARMVGHALMYGNGYSRIKVNRNGVESLEWLHSNRVQSKREKGRLYYEVTYQGDRDGKSGVQTVMPDRMFHLVGLTLDELGGMSIVDYARNTIGRQLATEAFGSDFFANMALPSGWFQHPGEMSEEAQKRFIQAYERRHQGKGKRFRAAILEEGMQYNAAGVSPEDALLVDALRWGVKDVARFFNLPPHRLGDDSRTGYNSVEQENRSYFDTTLGKWVSRIEAEASWKLFTTEELNADELFVEAKQDALFKADTAARFAAYAIAITNGIMTRNEVRSSENLNPVEGGNEFLVPLNMGSPAEQAAGPDVEEDDEEDDAEDPTDMETPVDAAARNVRIQGVICEMMQRACRLLIFEAKHAAAKPDKFIGWLNNLGTSHRSKLIDILGPAATIAAVHAGDDELQGLREATVSAIVQAAVDTFLIAAECQPDLLQQRIADTLPELNETCRRLSADLLLGGI